MAKPRIFIVIPAYNEARRIGTVLKRVKREGYNDIIVVDDCSRDATGSIAKKAGAIVVRHVANRGQGAALRTGITEALKRKADIIVTFDADGQHDATEIIGLTTPIARGEADVVLGSRFLGRAPGMPWYKWVGLKAGILVERVLLGVHLTDVHNGFRALSREAAKRIRITSDGMAHASEIVYWIRQNGLRATEVPVTIKYDRYAREHGQSVFNSFKIVKDILAFRLK